MTDGVGITSYDYVDAAANGALSLQQECFVATGQSTCSHTIDYAYDDLNRLAGRTIQGSGPETLSYDAINRVIRHTSDLGAFDISYLGQTSQITRSKLDAPGANLETTWNYLNNLGDRRLSAISNKGLAAGQFTDFAFTTSPENLITGITQNSDATVEIPNPPAQTVSFNELNEITSVSGQAYTYDANGNLLSDGTRTYSWDAENRLIGVTFAGDPDRTVTYAYDGIGRRIAIEDAPGDSAAALRKFVWCGTSLCQARDANYAVDRSYHEEGEAVASGGGLYYGRDQIGSVRRIFRASTEAPAIDYDPYGVKLQTLPWRLISPSQGCSVLTLPATISLGIELLILNEGSGSLVIRSGKARSRPAICTPMRQQIRLALSTNWACSLDHRPATLLAAQTFQRGRTAHPLIPLAKRSHQPSSASIAEHPMEACIALLPRLL